MSGGLAYVLDEEGDFAKRCNLAMVDLEPLLPESRDDGLARHLVENHARHTNSRRASEILANWAQYRSRFVKVFPKEYRRALAELADKNKAA
jgi:glutamate synthase domain-containing protein 3